MTLLLLHLRQLGSLTARADELPSVLKHFRRHAPLLERVDTQPAPGNLVLDNALFNGGISSLRVLRLEEVATRFPRKTLTNLRVVGLDCDFHTYGPAQILDFFESAPLLHTVSLTYSMPDLSEASLVPLRRLKVFTIDSPLPHSTLLRRLYIPIRVSLISKISLPSRKTPQFKQPLI